MTQSENKEFKVIVVGAGVSGLGVSVVLEKLGIDYTILEKDSIGSSFKNWPKETRLISPSFTGNSFNVPDLNSISPDTSPAFNLQTEHPLGKEYAKYLNDVSKYYKLKIQTNIEVNSVKKDNEIFVLNTSNGEYKSNFLIWAGGEFHYQKTNSFKGDELCLHYSKVESFSKVKGDNQIIIGGYEAGFDAATSLVKAGKKATVLDSSNFLDLVKSDSSYGLSPFTRDRIKETSKGISYFKNSKAQRVEFIDNEYIVTTNDGKKFTSKNKPINCTGFDSSLSLIGDLFEFKDGFPILNEDDQSIKTKNLFLVGPQVKHGSALFCFIYKYRQRFAIVAESIAKKLNVPAEKLDKVVQEYKDSNFYLKDLSSCDKKCKC